ncbi:ABC transporter substrate-binding protein [Patescibacteria group bacterium]|nr:ABC transporter substrate-binding protein [Patescibacteria group bacterium]
MILTRPFRKPWWWLKSFFKKQQKLILSAAAIGILALVLLRNVLPLLPQLKPKEKIGLVGQYSLNSLPLNLIQNIGRGLFKTSQDGTVLPDLALNWQLSDNDTRYLVTLKRGQLWRDGTPIISSDLSFDLPNVTVGYPDLETVEFKLSQPYSPFLSLLTRPVFKKKTIGAGDYSIKSVEWQGQYLKRLRLNGPNRELDYRFYLSHQAAWLGFKLGEVDRLENLIVNPAGEAWLNKIELKSRLNQQAYLGILFNLSDPNLSNKSMRQALAYAIKDKAPDSASRALSPLSPDSWAYNPNVKPYDFNPGQAKELFDKFTEESSFEGQLELTLGTSASFLQLAETMAQSWQETLGVKVNVKTINSLESDWQVILVAQEIPADPDQFTLWHSTQKTNITHYSDLKVDKLLEDGRQISDQAKRNEIYQDFQRFIVEDSPIIFLSHPTTYTISRK